MSSSSGKLLGKVALVSGSGRGIGRAIALKLASEGARLVLNDLDEAPAEEVAEQIRQSGGEAVICAGNVTTADFGERFLQNYGWSEWVGQRGAFASDAIACGVLLLGPDIEYPAHSHEAEELYLPLAGHGWWRSAQSDWRLRAPGTWIHHPSWTTHAMRTGAEPLLAAYVWRAGDLTAKSRIEK